MANEEHLKKLREGVNAWNEWRKENPEVQPDLAHADLREAALGGANLSHANLVKADLAGAELQLADLTKGLLNYAKLAGADLADANLTEAKFSRANLTAVNLQGADLTGVDLSWANLAEATLVNARFRNANFSNAILMANIRNTDLNEADLRWIGGRWSAPGNPERFPRPVRPAIRLFAKLFGDRSIRFDSTLVRNARFSPNSPDAWSVLRRNYTGPMLMFHLLLLIAFFLPYVAKTMMWVGVNRTQEVIQTAAADVNRAAHTLAHQESPGAVELAESLARLASREPCLSGDCEEHSVWELLIGRDRPGAYWLLATTLLLYNLGRALLTWRVGPLRDEEERSGHTPEYKGLNGYGWLIWPHRVVQVLLLVALVSFVYHGVDWLTRPVWLPG